MSKKQKTPYFLWDYNLSDQRVRQIIDKGDKFSRHFMVARILESAKYDDVWKYITLADLVHIFPDLKLKKEVRRSWEKAFKAWGITSE